MAEPDPRKKPLRIAGLAASVVALCIWAAHMVLKYVVRQPIPYLVWIAVALLFVGFALRRMAEGS